MRGPKLSDVRRLLLRAERIVMGSGCESTPKPRMVERSFPSLSSTEMPSPLHGIAEAYRRGGVKALEQEAARCMPAGGGHDGGHGWFDELIVGCSDAELSVPATWLLLQHAPNGGQVPAAVALQRAASDAKASVRARVRRIANEP